MSLCSELFVQELTISKLGYVHADYSTYIPKLRGTRKP